MLSTVNPQNYKNYYPSLLELAANAVKYQAVRQQTFIPELSEYDKVLHTPKATFITLYLHKQLRGCIGSLEAHQALVLDIAHNAQAAAFFDSRFNPVTLSELDHLQYHISILSTPEPMYFSSEADLLNQLRVNIDGIILYYQNKRSTFLPSVWQSLPQPSNFINQLKRKAGLSTNFWSNSIKIERYTSESFSSH